MISSTQFVQGVSQFFNDNVLSKVEPWKQFTGGMAVGMIAQKGDEFVREMAKNELIKAMGVVSENGEIDADTLFKAAEDQFKRQPRLEVDIPVVGRFAFDENDLRELRRAIIGK